MVHGLLLARVPPDVADDLLQEVFLKAMLQLSQLRSDDHLGLGLPRLLAIVRSIIIVTLVRSSLPKICWSFCRWSLTIASSARLSLP